MEGNHSIASWFSSVEHFSDKIPSSITGRVGALLADVTPRSLAFVSLQITNDYCSNNTRWTRISAFINLNNNQLATEFLIGRWVGAIFLHNLPNKPKRFSLSPLYRVKNLRIMSKLGDFTVHPVPDQFWPKEAKSAVRNGLRPIFR